VVKSRGMAHSREVRELVVGGKRKKGIDLGSVLTGIRQDTTVAG
jgi:hypothetical protein